ncbi:hypothetical protein KIPB_014522, partial [Kipferlia bialata]|eukprot:g14522.t1
MDGSHGSSPLIDSTHLSEKVASLISFLVENEGGLGDTGGDEAYEAGDEWDTNLGDDGYGVLQGPESRDSRWAADGQHAAALSPSPLQSDVIEPVDRYREPESVTTHRTPSRSESREDRNRDRDKGRRSRDGVTPSRPASTRSSRASRSGRVSRSSPSSSTLSSAPPSASVVIDPAVKNQ